MEVDLAAHGQGMVTLGLRVVGIDATLSLKRQVWDLRAKASKGPWQVRGCGVRNLRCNSLLVVVLTFGLNSSTECLLLFYSFYTLVFTFIVLSSSVTIRIRLF